MRFHPDAAEVLRRAIREVDGDEVFAIGEVEPGPEDRAVVVRLEVSCRGTRDAVPALLERPRGGQVVIHNHPSGVLSPSPADMALAARYGDDGVGVVIVDNGVTRERWVVEPHVRVVHTVDRARLERFFREDLARVVPDVEVREGQITMAHAVADALDGSAPLLVVEAGTGTGKSLAYLVPSILWATANGRKVAVSTHTRHLQAQLVASDLPTARRCGLEFQAALLKGRNNYLCRRKLDLALRELAGDAEAAVLQDVVSWAQRTEEGTLQDLGLHLTDELWERIESDADQTLRVRCPHYERCFYYQARRRAAAADIVVLNHALLLADLSLKAEAGDGLLPRFDRVILDEGHHLEDAATSAVSDRLTALGVRRAVAPLLPRKRSPGALQSLRTRLHGVNAPLERHLEEALDEVGHLHAEVEHAMQQLRHDLLAEVPQRSLDGGLETDLAWQDLGRPMVADLGARLARAASRLEVVVEGLAEVERSLVPEQERLDVRRAARRLGAHGVLAIAVAGDAVDNWCRWAERTGARGEQAALLRAPVDVAPLVRRLLVDPMAGLAVTSATLTVGGRFEHYVERVGLASPDPTARPVRCEQVPSPFDYARQSLLVLPKDLPRPEAEGWCEAIDATTVELVQAARGGAFVLCTSYAMVQGLAAALDEAFGGTLLVLAQGRGSRERLLERFKEVTDSVLVGTDSFWEGVSVKGPSLRLVVIPRLPFRVPTHPVAAARYRLIEARGQDAFRAYALPQAVLKLRQGFGRLIRGVHDRGVVAVLDRRVHEMWYGRVFLASLPPATRLVAPRRVVVERVRAFLGPGGDDGGRTRAPRAGGGGEG